MKKFLSTVLVLAMMLSLFVWIPISAADPISFPASFTFEESDTTTTDFANYFGSISTSTGAITAEAPAYDNADIYGIGRYLKLTSARAIDFSGNTINRTADAYKGKYLVVEYDMMNTQALDATIENKGSAVATALTPVGFNTSFRRGSGIEFNYKNGELVNFWKRNVIAGTYTPGEWVRLKFIMQLSDASGNLTTTDNFTYYVNGVQGGTGSDYHTNPDLTEILALHFVHSKGTTGLDNLSIQICDANSFGVEKGALIKKIRDIQKEYGDGSAIADAKTLIDEAKAVYESTTANDSDVTTAIEKLDEAVSKLDAIPPESIFTRTVWNFEEDESVPGEFEKGSTKGEAFDLVTDADDITLNQYLKGSATGTWSNFYWTPGTYTTFDNEVLELEFDLKAPTFPSSNDFQFRLGGGSEQFRIGIYAAGGVYRATTDSSTKVTIPTIDGYPRATLAEWTRVKFVFENKKITKDSTEYTGRKLVGIYVNNENIINTSHASFSSDDPTVNGCLWFGMEDDNTLTGDETDFTRIWFVGRANPEEFDWDNLSVTQYTAGVDAPNLSELVTAIRAAQEDYQEDYTEFGADASLADTFTAYDTSIVNAWNVYKTSTSTQTEFHAAIANMKRYRAMFGAPEILSVTYGGADGLVANGSITGVVLRKTYRTNDAGIVLAGLYDGTTKELKGVTAAKNVFTDKAVGEVTVTFANAITVPESTEGLYVKVFLWNDLTGMNALDMLQE